MNEIFRKVYDDYQSLIEKRKEAYYLAEYIRLNLNDVYYTYNDNAKDIIEFSSLSDKDLLMIAYKDNFNELDLVKEHIYVYLASFKKSMVNNGKDTLVNKDSDYADYSVYAELIGSDTRINVLVENREEFENNNKIISLEDSEPFSTYYDLRYKYLLESIGLENENIIKKGR